MRGASCSQWDTLLVGREGHWVLRYGTGNGKAKET